MFTGLRFKDLCDPKEDMDIKEALARLLREIVDARNERLKHAMDLSMKHEYLYDDLQPVKGRRAIEHRMQVAVKQIIGFGAKEDFG
ncbi:hypothetical protein IFM89_031321 [Coptis chinensis]|uniref:Uncharacterized protein n=1 Tax=Coptis chinensis TaxID=261450 RepID=A0A835IYR0_9MAGN|nr:hypothetical protein IFM89_031321 [Coptis chinensis]